MLTEPHKELRFTRAAQAVPFWLVGAVLTGAAVTIVAISFYRPEHPDLPHPAWAVVPLILAWAAIRIAHHCTRRAYLILTPLGIEIFPFLRPEKNLQLIYWAQISSAEFDDRQLTLHFTDEKTSGIHLSLTPIPGKKRPLLAKAIEGRLNEI